MDSVTARRLILDHAGFIITEGKVGLVGRLRPFQGLLEEDFAELVQALIGVFPELQASSSVNRTLVAALWDMCHSARILVLNPDSGVRRNKLVAPDDLEKCQQWIEAIESFALRALQGLDLPMCLFRVTEYILSCRPFDLGPYRAILPDLESCQHYDDQDVAESAKRAAIRVREYQE